LIIISSVRQADEQEPSELQCAIWFISGGRVRNAVSGYCNSGLQSAPFSTRRRQTKKYERHLPFI